MIKGVGAGYTFFWSGHKREMHESGEGFAIITGLGGKLSGLPKGIDRPMTLTLPLSGIQHASIISAYAITKTSQIKSTMFYDDLDSIFSATPKRQAHPSQ